MNQPTFNSCNSSLGHIILQTINTAARLVMTHLHFCTGSNTMIFAID